MNTHVNITTPALVYNGVAIRDQRDMLSLTDMWKSDGADASKRPVDWLRGEQAQRFIQFLAEDLGMGEVGKSHFGLVKASKGGATGGATFANWQLAMAYAKYLSPAFHAWCNEIVRAHMEGKAVATATSLTEYDIRIIGNTIKNCAGIVIREQLSDVLPQMVAGYIAERHLSIADGVTAGEICDLSRIATKYPRGVSARVSKQMSRFCAVRNISVPVTRLGRVRAQVFPTNAAREWLDLEGRALIRRWIEEKQGQKHLRLIGGRS